MTPHKQKGGIILHFCVLHSCSPNIVSTEPLQQKDESLVLETPGNELLLGDSPVPVHVEGLEQVLGSLHGVKHGAVPVGVPELPGEAEAGTLEADPGVQGHSPAP